MKLDDILVNSAYAALSHQLANGAMPPGHNGPWRTPETPLRNTGYWLLTFLKAAEVTDDVRFRSAAEAAAGYLADRSHRPGSGGIFYHRDAANGDCGNGLIGQAWTIEAMLLGGVALERPEMVSLAERCFMAHGQEESSGLWNGTTVDGSSGGVCRTFNQQLWFASMGACIAETTGNGEVRRRTEAGLRGLFACAGKYSNGVFEHVVRVPLYWVVRNRRDAIVDFAAKITGRRNEPRQVQLAIGYHSFCLYALALLKRTWPEHWLWKRGIVETALTAIEAPGYWGALDGNRFSFSYNVTGIENAYALEVFAPERIDRRRWWLDCQFERTYDGNASFLWKGACDPSTAAARLYEATRLKNIDLSGDGGAAAECSDAAGVSAERMPSGVR